MHLPRTLSRFLVLTTILLALVAPTPVAGRSYLAATTVESHALDSVPPSTPTGLLAISSYNAVLLDWTDNGAGDLDGYHVYRADSPASPYTRLTEGQLAADSRYEDGTAVPHVTYTYAVSAVDVYGNESDQSAEQSVAALDVADATLPLYQLDVPPENLAILYDNPWTNDEVTGTFTYEGQIYPVEVRFRGNSGRDDPKKSWKIIFPDDSPFPWQDRINVNANYGDSSLMRSKLAFDLHEASGIRPPQAEHVLLVLNGEYIGVHTRCEQVDEGFLERTGRNPDASIYKAVRDFTQILLTGADYYRAYDKKTNENLGYDDIISFVELINNTPDETFAYELARVFDVAAYLDYYAVIVLTVNTDFTHFNAYLLHDLETDRWEVVPWDLDHTFRHSSLPIDMGTLSSPIVTSGSNVLLSRVLDAPQFRAYYCHRLGKFMDTFFSDVEMHFQVDATYGAIEQDGLRDWYKRYREDNRQFTTAPDRIKAFGTERKDFLWGEMATYCPTDQPYLRINEFMADNGAASVDPADGGYEDWFEVYNFGLEDVNLQGLYLTDNLSDTAKFTITQSITIPSLGFTLFWADDETEQGPNHVNFTLSGGGGAIGIFSGTQPIDVYVFGPQTTDVSEARYPDGVNAWIFFDHTPTPSGSNLLAAPVVGDATRAPALPAAADTVTVTATITDDGALLAATLHYQAARSNFVTVTMTALGGDLYAAQIPPHANGVRVAYYILASDDDGQTSADPSNAPNDAYEYIAGYQPPPLFINEFMADNETTLEDPGEPGEFPDWLELYNPGPGPADLGGMYLTDDLSIPTKFRIGDGITVPMGGFALFWADEDTEQGSLHTDFKLGKGGESIGLFDTDANGNHPLDVYTFGPQTADVSEGRCPDGGAWTFFADPTPGATNEPCSAPPIISNTAHTPTLPTAADVVTVTTTITDDGALLAATLYYSATGSGFVSVTMELQEGDLYAASIPPQSDATRVAYYIFAGDDGGQTSTDPFNAPANAYEYTVGYQPPVLFINEFMADNENFVADEFGEHDDWFELYNPGPDPVNLGLMYLTDDLNDPTQFDVSGAITVPAGGFVLFWADGDTEQGPFHTNFKLGAGGEEIGLFGVEGAVQIDGVVFGAQTADVSEGRCPDGGDAWMPFAASTPKGTNGPCSEPPVISSTAHMPTLPTAADTVTVTAIITDDWAVISATLWYSAGAGLVAAPMASPGGEVYARVVKIGQTAAHACSHFCSDLLWKAKTSSLFA